MKTISFFRLMPHVLLLTFFLLFMTLSAFSQQGWTRTYGGTNDDYGEFVQQTSDGGYIVTGWTLSFGAGGGDVYLIKTNASGDTLWTKTYGGTSSDYGNSVHQTTDGGYIIAGEIYSLSGRNAKVWLIKTNASGDTLWTKTYGGTNNDWGSSVQQTSDGGYIVTGWTTSFGAGGLDVYLIKTNASGDTLWTRTYGGTGWDQGNFVCQTTDSGYIVAGYTNSFGDSFQVYLIKTNASGNTLWTRTYGGTGDDESWSVQQTSDGGYIIAGSTRSFGAGYDDVYLIKTNASGDTLWTRTYGGTGNEEGYSVQQTSDGGYIVAGYTSSFGAGNEDVYLIKANASGDTLWTKTYGGTNYDEGSSVQQTSDGGYFVAGTTNSFGAGNQDVYLIKTDANGNVGVETPVRQLDVSTVRQLKSIPNPFTSYATVPEHKGERFELYDIAGRRVGTYQGDRIAEGVAPGVYFLRPEGRDGKPQRIVKVR